MNLRKYAVACGMLATGLVSRGGGSEELQLKLELESDKSKITKTEKFNLEIRFTNTGKSPVFVYDEITWSGTLRFVVYDDRGRVVRPPAIFEPFAEQFDEKTRSKLVEISPTETLTKAVVLDPQDYIRGEGRYVMKVTYLSPVEWAMHEGVSVWNKSHGVLTARWEFEVVN